MSYTLEDMMPTSVRGSTHSRLSVSELVPNCSTSFTHMEHTFLTSLKMQVFQSYSRNNSEEHTKAYKDKGTPTNIMVLEVPHCADVVYYRGLSAVS